MRILYLAPDPVPAPKGAAVRIARTVATLRDLGHEVEMHTPRWDPPEAGGGLGTAERSDEVPMAHAPDSLRPAPPDAVAPNYLERMLAWREEAGSWLRGRRADVVQFRSIWEGVAALDFARRTGARAVWEAHGMPSLELPYHYPALRGRPALLAKVVADERTLVEQSALVMSHSHTGALHLLRLGVRGERIAVVPNAVDVDAFRPAPPPPAQPPLRIVYQGTLAPWQGLEVALEALALLRGRVPAELHVVGPARATWRASLRALARRLRVHHLLHLSPAMAHADLAPVLQTAHVCIAPLPADARNVVQGCCPLKLLEYMACGRPILSTAIAPVEELLEDGVTARLVAPGSAVALADGIAWMAAHPAEREALGQAARASAEQHWTGARFRERLAAALERLD